ncbi:uncharacterized protein TNCV_2986511 [Trichonephila clavipes]|nr:uncharacterized protein TNCV_2986511 [Trichonephila clavipes]
MHGYRLDTSCSIFTAEAVAIYRALQLIDSTMPRKYCIYTDSMSVLEALENYHDRCHPVVCTILDITSRLYSKGFDIVFCWLPSHVGIIGNEQADSAAKSATTHLPLAVPLSDMKRVIMHHIFKIWQESWSQQLDNKLHSVKPVIGAWPVMPMRRTDVKLTRLRIGHTRFTHRHLFGEHAPECPSCNVSYTVHHILIDHISHILHVLSPSIQASLYVDDLQISCEGSDMRLIERQLQTAVNNIVKWCDTNGHSISASKSCCVHFCRKRGIHPDPEIRIRAVQIPVVPDVRFLGVIFDRRLTFLPHILHLRKRCEKSLNLLKVLSNTSWGADRTSLLRVYQAIVLSRIDYGCVVYGSACNSTLKKLDPVHHMALRICSGAFRTSPMQSLYVNCHQLPLDLRRRKLSLAFYF